MDKPLIIMNIDISGLLIGRVFEGASLKIDDKNKLIKVLKGLANSKYDRLLSKGRENIIKKCIQV